MLIPDRAEASGFALRETGAAGQGNAFAGATAGAGDDISTMANNPATMTLHPGQHFSGTVTAIVPKGQFNKSGATFVGSAGGGNIGGGNGGDDIGPDALVPAVYYARQINADWFAGVSVTAPFGLVSEYDANWVGRYHAIKSDIKAMTFNPVVAHRLSNRLSVGGGVQIAYTRGILSNAIDFGSIDVVNLSGANGGAAGANDGHSTFEGDDLALGYNLGFLYQFRPDTRFGFAYRSKLHNRLDGAAHFDTGGAVGNAIATATGAFRTTGTQAEMNLPEMASLGVHHRLSPQWEVMAELAWTGWSRIRELRVTFDNTSQSHEVSDASWNNSMFYSVGATYKPNDRWTLRAGVALDETPVPDSTRTPRVPDEDRFWLSFGARYQVTPSSVLDIGYTHLFISDASINLLTGGPGNTFRGNLSGSYELSTDVLAVQYRTQF